ncbi:hypothetical protein HanIR_Chr05g0253201 [Helianthus annuus]|nr:hypothetical protein HanIR_Chr05g0253201 [Helianthus annuus]
MFYAIGVLTVFVGSVLVTVLYREWILLNSEFRACSSGRLGQWRVSSNLDLISQSEMRFWRLMML